MKLITFHTGTGFTKLSTNLNSNYKFDASTNTMPSFASLLALFFPSVTGIMAGSNRSGMLADPGRSISIGTLGAIGITCTIYISFIFGFGAVME